MPNVLDGFPHESLAVRVARKLKAVDVIDALSDLFFCVACRCTFVLTTVLNLSPRRYGLNRGRRRQDSLYRAWQPWEERHHRKLQRPPA
jgi:hypothetical protein